MTSKECISKPTPRPRSMTIPVRQTLTSKIRLERGNQLQYHESVLQELKKNTTISNVDVTITGRKDNFKKPAANKKTNYIQQNKIAAASCKKTIPKIVVNENLNPDKVKTNVRSLSFVERNKNVSQYLKAPAQYLKASESNRIKRTVTTTNKTQRETTNTQSLTAVNKTQNSTTNKLYKSALRPSVLPCKNPKTNPAPKAIKKTVKTVTIQSPLRKSLSAMHFKRVSIIDPKLAIHKSQSVANITRWDMSTIKEDTMFTTPSVSRRRSVVHQTPATSTKSTMSPWSGCWSPSAVDLKRRLSIWVEKRGKPLQSYHHLRCFGIPQLETAPIDEEDKENIEVPMTENGGSYESILEEIEGGRNAMKEKTDEDKFAMATDALYDLHKLISDGYPRDQCEAWLDVITTRFGELEDQPQYWECRAALEESRGDFSNAVDCYTNAIIQGAKVENVDECLENLLEKFNILNISPSRQEISPNNAKHVDARNIFKSKIIKFAIKEKSKKCEITADNIVNYSATPVRRSTRNRRSQYASTPGIKICSTLEELDSSVRKSLHFQVNKALHK